MSISCLNLAVKAKLCIFHTTNNMRLHTTASRPGTLIIIILLLKIYLRSFFQHRKAVIITINGLENGYFSLKKDYFCDEHRY